MKNRRNWLLTLIFLGSIIAIFSQCLNLKDNQDARGEAYAGSDKCIKCHGSIYASYLQTAHYQSSRPATIHSVHGNFAGGHNRVTFKDGSTVSMEKKDSGLYQVSNINGKQDRAQRFDIVFGRVKAETYLYWKGNGLFQLPISYFKGLNDWSNSPGYTAAHAYFDRPIVQRCFECHSSYIKELPQQNTAITDHNIEFDKGSLIYGIDCERCHGPAAAHADFQTAHPEEKKARYIVVYKLLTRKQRLDACAVCHSGNKDPMQASTFDFKPGDALEKFKELRYLKENNSLATLDVHGNQNGLLALSKCFLMSNMDCGNCHDTHKNEASDMSIYSQKCMKCHNSENHNFCKAKDISVDAIKANCIECHMPLKPSNSIGIFSTGDKKEMPYFVRTHYIAIYPSESKKILAFVNRLKTGRLNFPVN